MPVGTAATVKALYTDQVESAGADILLGNTYHLMLRPGSERLHRLGGLHKFMRWNKPILTDSGGFQVWSLAGLRKLKEEGVSFKSHIDGSSHFLSPERSIEIQADHLGADISMQLDECTPYPATHEQALSSMQMSIRWGKRSKDAFGTRDTQTLFGIVQGSDFEDAASSVCRAIAGDRLWWIRDRWSCRGRGASAHGRGDRFHGASPAEKPTALSDGRWKAD